jgi:uncharacterized membrane protein YfcA
MPRILSECVASMRRLEACEMSVAFALTLVIATMVVAVGSALQAATGMGMALFAAPLLALIDPGYVPGPALCAVMALSAAVAWRERVAIDRHILTTALLGLGAGCVIGAILLAFLIGLDLTRVFAVLILAAVFLSVAGLHLRTNKLVLLLGGMASGVLGTMSGVHGPPIALVLQHEAPDRLRATLCAFFAVGGMVSILALAAAGVFGIGQIGLGLELLPGVVLGFAIAPAFARRINRRRARVAVLVISALSALVLLLR